MGKLEPRYFSMHPMRWDTQKSRCTHKQSKVCQFRFLDSRASRGNYRLSLSSNRQKYHLKLKTVFFSVF